MNAGSPGWLELARDAATILSLMLAVTTYMWSVRRRRRSVGGSVYCYFDSEQQQVTVGNGNSRFPILRVAVHFRDSHDQLDGFPPLLLPEEVVKVPMSTEGQDNDVVVVQFEDPFGQRWQRDSDMKLRHLRRIRRRKSASRKGRPASS